MEADEPASSLFFLQSGMVSVKLPNGVRLATLVAGMVFGEMALLEERRSADVWADTLVECLELPLDAYVEFREKYPQVGERIVRNLAVLLAKRLILANTKIDLLTSLEVFGVELGVEGDAHLAPAGVHVELPPEAIHPPFHVVVLQLGADVVRTVGQLVDAGAARQPQRRLAEVVDDREDRGGGSADGQRVGKAGLYRQDSGGSQPSAVSSIDSRWVRCPRRRCGSCPHDSGCNRRNQSGRESRKYS